MSVPASVWRCRVSRGPARDFPPHQPAAYQARTERQPGCDQRCGQQPGPPGPQPPLRRVGGAGRGGGEVGRRPRPACPTGRPQFDSVGGAGRQSAHLELRLALLAPPHLGPRHRDRHHQLEGEVRRGGRRAGTSHPKIRVCEVYDGAVGRSRGRRRYHQVKGAGHDLPTQTVGGGAGDAVARLAAAGRIEADGAAAAFTRHPVLRRKQSQLRSGK